MLFNNYFNKSFKRLSVFENKLNYEIKSVNNIQILDNDFPGLKNQRRVVQWLFSEETSISDFKRFDVANGGYLIAQVSGITEKGLSSVENSSFKILPEVIKSKKFSADSGWSDPWLKKFNEMNN